MKHLIVATIAAATLIAPAATLAQDGTFNFPTFYDEFSGQAVQPVTKLDVSTENTPVVVKSDPAKDK